MEIKMKRITNKYLSQRITEIENKLHVGQIDKIQKNVNEIKQKLEIITPSYNKK
tara:strand:- start:6 stop:167 length:162 start_codon:yes stop_codon:yes gene_type:complete